ncbi:hypothetical protein [Sphingobacterium sp. DR205]|uniref:hypothetical protein n=1 Tax=Sphingobacterium sp. DR205 TaxID=2713573 RepID=UPI0013E43C8F|nr:hypothetical protein [Sphingobacterium sp. DR205]QIH31569.1 hypothetical protein G6053_00990 [Sphingobacterium sp. DR205]
MEITSIIVITSIVSFSFVLFGHFNSQIIYPFLLILYTSLIRLQKSDINWMIRVTPLLYLIINMIMIYSPLNFLTQYSIRNLEGRGLIGLDRMIGISGSPAGPDILFTCVLIYTVFSIDKKNLIDRINIFVSLFVLLWTSSLSPVFSAIIAMLVVIFPKQKKWVSFLSMTFWLGLIYIYRSSSENIQILLKTLTSLRVRIWDDIWKGMYREFDLWNWLFGRDKMVEFVGLNEKIDANPHNAMLYLLEFSGIIGVIVVIWFVLNRVGQINNANKISLFLTILLLYYLSMSPIPLTMNGDPIILYLLFILLGRPWLFLKSYKS